MIVGDSKAASGYVTESTLRARMGNMDVMHFPTLEEAHHTPQIYDLVILLPVGDDRNNNAGLAFAQEWTRNAYGRDAHIILLQETSDISMSNTHKNIHYVSKTDTKGTWPTHVAEMAMLLGASPSGFATKAAAAKQRFYGLNYAPVGGKKEYYFLLVEPPKEKAFLRALQGTDSFNLKNYGTIVACGYGDAPEAVKHQMQEHYGAQF